MNSISIVQYMIALAMAIPVKPNGVDKIMLAIKTIVDAIAKTLIMTFVFPMAVSAAINAAEKPYVDVLKHIMANGNAAVTYFSPPSMKSVNGDNAAMKNVVGIKNKEIYLLVRVKVLETPSTPLSPWVSLILGVKVCVNGKPRTVIMNDAAVITTT